MTRRLVLPDRALMAAVSMLLVLAAAGAPAPTDAQTRISQFGRYEGYSHETYDGWNRYSVYVPMRDGIRIAVDYYLPTSSGMEPSEPLPVVLHYTRYLRAARVGGQLLTIVDQKPELAQLLRHGFAVAAADVRGTGASFGIYDGPYTTAEKTDGYEIVEWLAAQSWCDGHVGMHGRSYPGSAQYQTAIQAPPHLNAIFAEMASPSPYDLIYPGGTFLEDFLRGWDALTRMLDGGRVYTAAPVDADSDGTLRDAAVAEHAANVDVWKMGRKAKYRDSRFRRAGRPEWSWRMASPIYEALRIEAAGIPIYHLAGWYDIYTTQQMLMYTNLERVPQKLTIGPWTHSGGEHGQIHRTEILRWYDYWLKGVDNGIMREPPVHFFLMKGNNTVPLDGSAISPDEAAAEDPAGWIAVSRWPPPGARARKYYLAAGPSGSVASINDGMLSKRKPKKDEARDDYLVDYTSTVGTFTRWMDGYGGERPDGTLFFDERTSEDEKALTYTTEPLKKELRLAGHPVVHLWITSTHREGDVFVFLEEIDGDGRAHYVTEGALRTTFRALASAPWDNLGLPFHRCHRRDRSKLPGKPVELTFDLMATGIVFDRGHRVRVTVTGADAGHHALFPRPRGGSAPFVSIHRERRHRSYIELPVMR